MSQPFDFGKALKARQTGQALTGKDGVLTLLIKYFRNSIPIELEYTPCCRVHMLDEQIQPPFQSPCL